MAFFFSPRSDTESLGPDGTLQVDTWQFYHILFRTFGLLEVQWKMEIRIYQIIMSNIWAIWLLEGHIDRCLAWCGLLLTGRSGWALFIFFSLVSLYTDERSFVMDLNWNMRVRVRRKNGHSLRGWGNLFVVKQLINRIIGLLYIFVVQIGITIRMGSWIKQFSIRIIWNSPNAFRYGCCNVVVMMDGALEYLDVYLKGNLVVGCPP